MIAFPTDTVYGLGAGAFNEGAIQKLFEIKGREQTKAIAVLLGNIDQLEQVTVEMGETAQILAEKFWPGPLTIVVPRHPDLSDILSPSPTIGVRIPDHPTVIELLSITGPLAVTSANLSGRENAMTAQEVHAQLGNKIDLILDGGETPGGAPSTVVDVSRGKIEIIREGPISLETLQQITQNLKK